MQWVKRSSSANGQGAVWQKHRLAGNVGFVFTTMPQAARLPCLAYFRQSSPADSAESRRSPLPQPEPSSPGQLAMSSPGQLAMSSSNSSNALPVASDSAEQAAPAPPWNAEVTPPAGLCTVGDTWQPLDASMGTAMGCFSFIGPDKVVAEGKANQDFAFCLDTRDAAGESWLLCGVADGVTNASWQTRGAKQVAAAFITTMRELLSSSADFMAEFVAEPGREALAQHFTQEIVGRLIADRNRIEQERRLPPGTQNPDFYLSYYFHPELGTERRQTKWFLTTLLAAALGPKGGFLLLIGDGYARVDRLRDGAWRREGHTLSIDSDSRSARGPTAVVSPMLRWETVRDLIMPLPPGDADALGVLLSTDGILKTSNNQLDTAVLDDSAACEHFIRELCMRPAGNVYPDNLSLAFCRRSLGA